MQRERERERERERGRKEGRNQRDGVAQEPGTQWIAVSFK